MIDIVSENGEKSISRTTKLGRKNMSLVLDVTKSEKFLRYPSFSYIWD